MVWVGIGYCVRQASLAAIAYAGQTSNAKIAVSLLANISFVWTASITLSGASITLYIRERNQHRKTRDRLTDRITELETRWDVHRTSSMLTPEGLTRKEDE